MSTAVPPARRGPWILAVDVGSSSVRAQWLDASCVPLAEAARELYAWDTTPGGGMQADAESLLARCLRAIDRAVAVGREAGVEPAAVALATFWHGLVGMDAEGCSVTPLTGWGDGRARAAADALRGRLDEEAVHRRTGCFVHEAYPAARLVWLRGAAGDTFPRAATWGSIGEVLVLRLFGQARTSVSMASGTGLMDLRRMEWDAAVLDAVGLSPERLPGIDDEPLRGLKPEFASRWPELASIPWFPALGDGACASLGMGAVGRTVGLTVGTTAAVRVLRDDPAPVVPPGLWCYRLDARRTVMGRATSNAGNIFAWLRHVLALPPADELEAQLSAMRPAAHGMSVVPRLVPERPPRPGGPERAVMAGMTPATGPVEIARAWLEAAAFTMADALDAVEADGGRAAEVVAGGGALHASPAWARMVADALGRPLRLAPDPETTLRGAALGALERLGVIGDAMALAAADRAGVVLQPDAEAHEVYRAARALTGLNEGPQPSAQSLSS
jgi:gluconokinase